MTTLRTLTLPSNVARTDVETDRGTFAALTSRPHDSSLPRGNVVLIPGFTGSKEDFAALLPLLAEAGWGAASYDQRGQYESAATSGADYSMAGFAADARSVTAGLFGTSERVHLVGHSFGGLVGASAAVTYPDAWASLTLLCSGPGGFDGEKRADLLTAVQTLRSGGLEQAYQLKVEPDRERGQPVPVPQIEAWLHQRFLANSSDSLAAIARHLADAPDPTPQLVSLDLPVRVVRGERDDAWSHEAQDRLAAALGTRVVVIDGAGHSPAVEQPESTRDALVRIWLS